MQAKDAGAGSKRFDPGFASEGEEVFALICPTAAATQRSRDRGCSENGRSAEADEEAEKKWNHGTGFIAQGCVPVWD